MFNCQTKRFTAAVAWRSEGTCTGTYVIVAVGVVLVTRVSHLYARVSQRVLNCRKIEWRHRRHTTQVERYKVNAEQVLRHAGHYCTIQVNKKRTLLNIIARNQLTRKKKQKKTTYHRLHSGVRNILVCIPISHYTPHLHHSLRPR